MEDKRKGKDIFSCKKKEKKMKRSVKEGKIK